MERFIAWAGQIWQEREYQKIPKTHVFLKLTGVECIGESGLNSYSHSPHSGLVRSPDTAQQQGVAQSQSPPPTLALVLG